MMVRRILVITVAMVVATLLQASLVAHIRIAGFARPDLLIVVVVASALLTSAEVGISLGMVGGLLMAVMTGGFYGSYMVSRIAAGWTAAWTGRALYGESLMVPVIAVILATVVAEVLYFLMAPAVSARYWAISSVGEVLYNMVLILPIYRGMLWTIRGRKTRDPYERRLRRRR